MYFTLIKSAPAARPWFILACLFLAGYCGAQVKQTERFEIPLSLDERSENYTVVSGKESGLVLYHESRREGLPVLEVTKLDTALREEWRGVLKVAQGSLPLFSVIKNNTVHILCQNRTAGKGDLSILTLNLTTREYETFSIRNFLAFTPVDFLVLEESVMIAGYFNYRPFILHFSLKTRQSKILPGFFNEVGEHLQLSISDSGTVDVMVNAKNADRKKSLWIRKYDFEGTLLRTTVLEPEGDKNLIFGRTVTLPEGDEVVAGVYGRSGEYSRGVFVARIDPDGKYSIQYYNFGELQNFFRFMKVRREQRMRSRIERRKIRGKKIRLNYRLLVHELIPYGDQYILLGEAFSPQYRSQDLGAFYGGYTMGRSAGSTMVFDGYQYTHAIVIGFSKSGKLLWDNSFEINDVKTFKLDQFVKIQPEKEHINLLYLIENSLQSKIIRKDEVVEGKAKENLKTALPTDVSRPTPFDVTKLEYWYPGNLYAYGTQTLNNPTLAVGAQQRRVFFINKIVDK